MASIIDYYLNNNCITDAIDHAIENESFDSIIKSLDCLSAKISKEDLDELIFKIGSYLLSCTRYFTEPDYDHVKSFVIQLYCKYKLWVEASIVTLSNNFNRNLTAIETILSSCVNENEQAKAKQIACLLNRQSIYLHNFPNLLLKSLMATSKTLNLFNYVAKELDCQAPFDLRSTLPDFLMSPFSFSFHARLNRSKSRIFMLHVASGFANVAHGKDKLTDALLSRTPTVLFTKCGGAEGVSGVIGALGLINLWNPEVTLNSTLNRFKLYTQPELKAGAILACSLSRSNYRGDDEFDDFLDCPEFDCIEKGSWDEQACYIVGLGTAYSGTNNSEALFILRRLIRNDSVPLVAKGLSALSIGLISISTANHKVATNLLATLIQIDSLVNQPEELVTCWFICLSIGLIYLNRKGEQDELTEQINQLSSEKLKSIVNLTLNCCSFSGSGDVLLIQKMLHIISKSENKTLSNNLIVNDSPSTSKQDESIKSTLKSHSTAVSKSNLSTLKKRKALEKPSPIRKQYCMGEKSRKKIKTGHQAGLLNKEKPEGKNRCKLARLDEFSSIDDILIKIRSKRKSGSTIAMEPNPVRSARRFHRYSLDRRLSLPSTLVRPLKDSLSSSYDDTNIESDDGSDQPLSAVHLMESLEALNYSLDKIMSRKKSSNKAYITSISTTPPRLIIDSIATIGISLIAMGEEVGCSMAKRMLQQILINGSPSSKRMAPLAFALLSLSNPDPQILATLEKCSRYQMISMSINSIFAIGLCGSGSLDQKLSKIIDNLFEHFDSGPTSCLDALILTKGLLHLGRGLMTLSPYSYNNQLIFPTGLASILITIFSCLDVRSTFLGKLHHLIYYLTPAIRPRFIVTLDDKKLEPIEIPLGIGEPLNIHEQVGKLRVAKTSVTQNAPVILKDQERAEIYSDHYKPAMKFIEGMVVVKKID